ncbi:hypothetical protein [Aureimonas sp. SK2]|uniref:hypothetical protein n=1 Tax=Aureimonas sp. SK2 TaxID=3015992 RepID=UPI002443FD49|nr:hypothetical protein [Aureimonas sp. SK2]
MRALGTQRKATTRYVRLENAGVALVEAEGLEVGKRERGLFPPAAGGSFKEAFKDHASFLRVSPTSPRPAEMLDHITVSGGTALTAQDWAIHEILMSAAYDAATNPVIPGDEAQIVGGEMQVRMGDLLVALGPNARRKNVLKSLRALRMTEISYGTPGGRTYANVPMLVGWHETEEDGEDFVVFMLPSPIWRLLTSQRSYANLELRALAGMATRYGIFLYRHLALRFARVTWNPDAPDHEIELTPEDAARVIGFDESPVVMGRLTTALKRAVEDLAGKRGGRDRSDAEEVARRGVRAFAVEYLEPRHRVGKGNPIAAYRLKVTTRAPELHRGRSNGVSAQLRQYVGAPDDPWLRVNSHVWAKAATLAFKHKRAAMAPWLFKAWLVALEEALVAAPVTPEYGRRMCRGGRLLRLIRAEGPDRAAYAFAVEEIENPDLLDLIEIVGTYKAGDIEKAADAARRKRVADWKNPDRKQRMKPLPKGPTKEEREAAEAERKAAIVAERTARFEGANVVELDVRFGRAEDAKITAEGFKRYAWPGSRKVEIRLSYRAGDNMRVVSAGWHAATPEFLEGLVSTRSDDFSGYRPLYDAEAVQPEAAPPKPRRPGFLPGSHQPKSAGVEVITYPMPTAAAVGALTDDCPF